MNKNIKHTKIVLQSNEIQVITTSTKNSLEEEGHLEKRGRLNNLGLKKCQMYSQNLIKHVS